MKKGKEEAAVDLHKKDQMDWAMMYQAKLSMPMKANTSMMNPEVTKHANIHLTPSRINCNYPGNLINLNDETTKKRKSITVAHEITK